MFGGIPYQFFGYDQKSKSLVFVWTVANFWQANAPLPTLVHFLANVC